jgi:hypothetical protein
LFNFVPRDGKFFREAKFQDFHFSIIPVAAASFGFNKANLKDFSYQLVQTV